MALLSPNDSVKTVIRSRYPVKRGFGSEFGTEFSVVVSNSDEFDEELTLRSGICSAMST